MEMWSRADRQAKLTLVGASLIKFASSLALVWGTLNIYVFSYLKNKGEHIDSSTNSKLLLCAIIPLGLTVPFANPFSRLVGYKTSIRLFSVVFMVSPLMLNFSFTTVTFAIFWIIIPIFSFLMAGIPLLGCLWTQFPKDLSKVSSVAVLMFSFGMIVWNLLFMQMINPDNVQADVDAEGFPVFPQSVSGQVLSTSNLVFVVAGMMNVVGSFLVTKRAATAIEQPLGSKEGKGKQWNAQKGIVESDVVEGIERAVSSISSKSQKVKSLKNYLFDRKFILIFLVSGLNPIYLVYLMVNIKLIYMPIINDDHFLSYCVALVTVSAVTSPFWGYLCDSNGFRTTLLLVTAFDSFVKIFGIYCDQKLSLAVLFFLLGSNDKGLLTIIGPGMVGMFGVEMATELIPYKGLAVIIAYTLAPAMQILVQTSTQNLLLVYFLFSVGGVIVSAYLKYKVHYKEIDPAKDFREMEVLNKEGQ